MVTGDATVEDLREQIAYLKEKVAERDETINGLRAHHIAIYQRFHAHSPEAELLIGSFWRRKAKRQGNAFSAAQDWMNRTESY